MRVPFSPPDIRQEDIDAVTAVLRSGWITTGPVGKEFETALATYMDTPRVITLSSCTIALELALRLLDVGEGDEVIVPAYTYTASAAVVNHVGAELVLVDVAPGKCTPDVATIVDAVTERTKAIIVVDIGGVPFPADELRAALSSRTSPGPLGLVGELGRPAVITDAAHSLGATRGTLRSGQLGDLTAFSFHAVKNLTTSEGGALTWRPDLGINDEHTAQLVRRIALHGQSKDALAKTQAGQWEYDIVEAGYKANMPDILAALGLSQLSRYDEALARRHEIVARYVDGLADLAVVMPHAGQGWRSSAHLALVDLGELAPARGRIIQRLAAEGIASNVHYKPLPMLTAYQNLGFSIDDFPLSLAQYRAELTLPLHTLMSDYDVSAVISAFRNAVALEGRAA